MYAFFTIYSLLWLLLSNNFRNLDSGFWSFCWILYDIKQLLISTNFGVRKIQVTPCFQGVRKSSRTGYAIRYPAKVCGIPAKCFLTPIAGFERWRCHLNFPEVKSSEFSYFLLRILPKTPDIASYFNMLIFSSRTSVIITTKLLTVMETKISNLWRSFLTLNLLIAKPLREIEVTSLGH